MAKGNIRSMRFSDEILEMIESQAGDTFTAKFEALVTRCVWELPAKERELANIQAQIENERKKLAKIRTNADALQNKMNNLSSAMDYARHQINKNTQQLKELLES